MTALRFIGLLFVFIGVLASSSAAIALLVLMLRFWPVLLVATLAFGLFAWLLKRADVQIVRQA
ncbi:hypothetical protein DNK06_13250 [Pseudomonas daroniae]|uniref:Uncharacterized protein n=1 Tax=Phytopseudomonas daroniae TaxID=2487519 RepID=A0A4Q9QKS3_9GAMM|nr:MULTISPECIES: hypothetical protein [Pseudomonadaceae]TBU79370.1 hypothetical protein DNK06_13250 [Pseudomonas daroniae]TBU79454.1 hypothetical protein DNK31_19465 [Pseudomonas sp. FRB 228]TBU91470.1 hypothetical protein DNJ99_10770 [Pseudomonas daroniae]TBV09518.1 hypothetical protein DNK08_08860 [Stutzerimonas kirkiae]